MTSSSPICLMTRDTSTSSWLWHRRLSHLNFATTNLLANDNLVTDLPKFNYSKDQLCPSCEMGKSKRATYKSKLVPSTCQKLHLLHMDLCGPMRVTSINGKKYILVIVDDHSRYTWVYFIRSKDEALETIITFLKQPMLLPLRALPIAAPLYTPDITKLHMSSLTAKNRISPTSMIYNKTTKKVIEAVNVKFNELSTMASEQRNLDHALQ
ncbi:retrovirus-related pol polyprotein from transposon TNT 1-94 [Tanacetum coccineum]